MSKFQQFCSTLDTAIGHLLSGLLVFLVVDVSWQVLTRFLLSQPSSVTEELARFLLIWIGLLGAVHAYRARMHLGIDLFTRKLSQPTQNNLYRFVHLACALFAVAIFIIGGGNLMFITWSLGQNSPSLGLPMAAVYSVLPLSGLLMCIYSAEAILLGGSIEPTESTAE